MDTSGKTISCRAAVAWAVGQPLSLEEVQVEPPRAGEVRIKMASTSICGTDARVLKGWLPLPFPLIPGHEGAGTVESVGPGVTSVRSGDLVLTLIIPQCRECQACLHPRGSFCDKQDVLPSSGLMLDGSSRFFCRGHSIYHSFRASTFTEFTVVPEISVAKIPAAAPLDRVCLLSCGVPTGYGAAVHAAQVTPGSTCVVIGLGGVGSAIILGCKVSGAARIIGVDINEDKFPGARKLGVTDVLNPGRLSRPLQEEIQEMTGGGADFVFEAAGLPETLLAAWESCHKSYGTCLAVGLSPDDSKLVLNATPIITGHTLKGVCLGGYKTRDCVPQMVSDYLQGRLDIDPLVTHQLPFAKLQEAMELYRAGKPIRCVLLF
ncbi:alcohol dehydrogenase 1-like [Erinaceus europaeus]|uniref:Alcohol dehydrogenase 1-like n=1 Tax=Erinaceus europaeus TaxID=9365 RepID=A0ABM3X0I1_ERIEU|nr:alcohol dehydrogenase 1-like [Erinaceus europaeus]